MESFKNRLVHGWNAFKNVRQEEETSLPINLGFISSENPSRPRLSMSSEKSIIAIVTTRIALDVASFDFQHVKVDQNGRYHETFQAPLSDVSPVSGRNVKSKAEIERSDCAALVTES